MKLTQLSFKAGCLVSSRACSPITASPELIWHQGSFVFPHGLGAMYFRSVGQKAAEAGVISPGELQDWCDGIDTLHNQSRLFGTVGYFLFAARVCS